MADLEELRELKRKLSPTLLRISGVSGVGITRGTLAVYLSSDRPEIKRAVGAALRLIAPEAAVELIVSGPFRRLSGED